MALEVLVMRGASRGDCVDKIVKRYGAYFNILRERTVSSRGLFGLIPREEVEVEFYLSPQRGLQPAIPQPAPAAPPTQEIHARERQVAGLPTIFPATTTPSDGTTLDFVEAKKKVLAAAGKDPDRLMKEAATFARKSEDAEVDQREMMAMLREIREKMNSGAAEKKDHPNLERVAEILKLNDFSESYTKRLLERAHRELPLEILDNFDLTQDRVLEWIGESIRTYSAAEHPPRKPGDAHSARIMVLVGPTGVGKTTTIAKLAAIYGVEGVENASTPKPLSVRMITIDAYRIGAQRQLEEMGKIMEIPVSPIDNHLDLQREIDLYREVSDLILVDTIGRSPKDSAKLGEMKQMLDACGPKAEVHLALTAATKTDDLLHIMRQFEPFNYRAVLLTKLDETRHVGNIISALAERDKPVSYVTCGQGVPKDIKKANIIQFLINLEEFRVDREAFEKRFPAAEFGSISMELGNYGRPG